MAWPWRDVSWRVWHIVGSLNKMQEWYNLYHPLNWRIKIVKNNMSNCPLKIIHILPELGFGGAERLLVDILKFSDREKFHFQVWCLFRGGGFQTEIEKLGVPVEIFGKKSKLGLGLVRELTRKLQQEKPDIVHTHLFAGDCWGKIAAHLAKVPVIISTEHNLNFDESRVKQAIKILTYKWTAAVIAVSLAVKKYSAKFYKLSADKIQVVYNGIDLNRFKYKEPDLNKARLIFGCTGRLEEQKGQKFLVKAFADVVAKYPLAELWLVGNGSLRWQLEKLAARLGLSRNVKFLGQRLKMAELLNELDIFVLPSLWEGLGIAAMEAMACGLPVVASKVDGLRELITDGENGLLVEAASSRSLGKKMLEIADKPYLARILSHKARLTAEKNFDVRQTVEQYQKIYLTNFKNYEDFTD